MMLTTKSCGMPAGYRWARRRARPAVDEVIEMQDRRRFASVADSTMCGCWQSMEAVRDRVSRAEAKFHGLCHRPDVGVGDRAPP